MASFIEIPDTVILEAQNQNLFASRLFLMFFVDAIINNEEGGTDLWLLSTPAGMRILLTASGPGTSPLERP